MRAHLAGLYDPADVRHVFTSPAGDEIDCVDINKQPAMRTPEMKGKPIPTPPPLPPGGGDGTLKPSSDDPLPVTDLFGMTGKDAKNRQQTCPKGSIPVRKLTLADLQAFSDLEAFFRKTPEPPVRPGSADHHQYATAERSVTNYGASARLNLWRPHVESGAAEFSLTQIWISRGAGADLETIEAGLQVYPDHYGDTKTHFFIYSTSDNYSGKSFASGCYNLDCGRFIQTDPSFIIGGALTATSLPGGTQREITVDIVRTGSSPNWWIYVEGKPIGFYLLTLFDTAGVRDKASEVIFGGEIIDDRASHAGHTGTDMGTGALPSSGYRRAAYQRNILYYSSSTTRVNVRTLTSFVTDNDCYDISSIKNTTSWGTYFYFGGPGYNGNCQ